MQKVRNKRFAKMMLVFFSLLIHFFGTLSVAQAPLGEPDILASNDSGELSSAITDAMRSEIRDQRLFVIVRLGNGETSGRINRTRLLNTKSFMLRKGFDKTKSVFAEGERADGEGRIEFYIGSRLRLVILARRNEMPNLTCCPDYVPPTKKTPKRRGKS